VKNILRSEKAQSAAEFVVMLPVILALFAGVYQFSVISLRSIELRMIEREVMRFMTSDCDDDKRTGKVREFAAELAEKMGLDKDRLHVKLEAFKGEADEENRDFLNLNFIKSSLFKAGWKYVVITYEQELSGMFALIAGRETITLKTKLYTAKGGSFKITPESVGKWIGDFMAPKEGKK